jgi:hypothetical protein
MQQVLALKPEPGPVPPRGGSALTAAAAALMVAALVALCAACGSAPPRPQQVLSRYETVTGRHIVRDCGFSVPLAGRTRRSLWLFCDTLVTTRQGRELGVPILGAGTTAVGPGAAGRGGGALTEVTTPAVDGPGAPRAPGGAGALSGLLPPRAGPRPFLPVPANLTLPASLVPCAGPQAYPARWVTGAALEPDSSGRVLISYADYCVSGRNTFTLESFGLVGYDPAGNVLGPPTQVFTAAAGQQLPLPQALGSPVFRGGYLYLFGWCGPGCGHGGVFLARTLAAAGWWDNGFTYRYWTGGGWSPDLTRAAALTGRGPLAMSAGDYAADGQGLVMIEQTSAAGDFSRWQAAAPTGPWRKTGTGRVPCTAGKQGDDLCRALIGHPELSDRSDLLISFFNPGEDHVEALAFPW